MKKYLKDKNFWIGATAMSFIVVISNILVVYPIGQWLTWAAFTYPIAFFITDFNNRFFGTSIAKKVIFVGFLIGVILSIIFASWRIALASGIAFSVAQLLDVMIFNKVKESKWWKAPIISSLIASAIDIALFFTIAFYGTEVSWIKLAIGDYFAKLIMATALLIPFGIFYDRHFNKKNY